MFISLHHKDWFKSQSLNVSNLVIELGTYKVLGLNQLGHLICICIVSLVFIRLITRLRKENDLVIIMYIKCQINMALFV